MNTSIFGGCIPAGNPSLVNASNHIHQPVPVFTSAGRSISPTVPNVVLLGSDKLISVVVLTAMGVQLMPSVDVE